jgi:hypothetical protein
MSARDESGEPVVGEWGDNLDDDDDGGFDDDNDEVLKDDEPRFHDGMPITGYYRGEPIPDLNELPQDRWLDVLRPLSYWPRSHAVSRIRAIEHINDARAVIGQLLSEDGRRLRSLDDGPPPPLPTGAPPPHGASRQINVRLGPSEHADLLKAATVFATRPTTLARMLIVRGVNRALYEERRDL